MVTDEFVSNFYNKLAHSKKANKSIRQVRKKSINENSIKVFFYGDEINPKMKRFISSADHEVIIQLYKYYDFSDAADDIKEALIELNQKATADNKINIKIIINYSNHLAKKYPQKYALNPLRFLNESDEGTFIRFNREKVYLDHLNFEVRLHEHDFFNSYHSKQIIVDQEKLMLFSGDPDRMTNYKINYEIALIDDIQLLYENEMDDDKVYFYLDENNILFYAVRRPSGIDKKAIDSLIDINACQEIKQAISEKTMLSEENKNKLYNIMASNGYFRNHTDKKIECATIIKDEYLAIHASFSFDQRLDATLEKPERFEEEYSDNDSNNVDILYLEKNPTANPIKGFLHKSPHKLAVIDALNCATESIHIMTPNFNDQDIVKAVISAIKRGVVVKMMMTRDWNLKEESTFFMGGTNLQTIHQIYNAIPFHQTDNFQPCWNCKKDGSLVGDKKPEGLHAKCVIVDSQLVIAGSSCLDKQSTYFSNETDYVLNSEKVASQFLDEFNVLYEQGRKQTLENLTLYKQSIIKDIEKIKLKRFNNFFMKVDNELTEQKDDALSSLKEGIKNCKSFGEITTVLNEATQVGEHHILSRKRWYSAKSVISNEPHRFFATGTIKKIEQIRSKHFNKQF